MRCCCRPTCRQSSAGGQRRRASRLRCVTPDELRAMMFDPGSMAPKVAAACRFSERNGRTAADRSARSGRSVPGGAGGYHYRLVGWPLGESLMTVWR